MSFIGSRMSNTMFGLLSGKGFTGSRMRQFTNACSIGSQKSIVGKSFTTVSGSVSGPGFVVSRGLISRTAFSTASGFGFVGPKLFVTCECFASALTRESALAELVPTSTSGNSVVRVGSIAVVNSEWSKSIAQQGYGSGFMGPKWPQMARSLARGGFVGYKAGTGAVAVKSPGTGIII